MLNSYNTDSWKVSTHESRSSSQKKYIYWPALNATFVSISFDLHNNYETSINVFLPLADNNFLKEDVIKMATNIYCFSHQEVGDISLTLECELTPWLILTKVTEVTYSQF